MAQLTGFAKAQKERDDVKDSLKILRADKDTREQLTKQLETNAEYINRERKNGFRPYLAEVHSQAIKLRLRDLGY